MRSTSFAPHKLSPAIRVVLPSADLAVSVSPRAIKPGEVRIVKALVGGCKRRVAFFHYDGVEMTTAQEIAAEMVEVVVCCHPNRLPSEIKGKHLLAAYLPPAHLACLTYEGLEVGMGEDGSVVCEYFLAEPGYGESAEASFSGPTFKMAEQVDGTYILDVMVPNDFDSGPTVVQAQAENARSARMVREACSSRAAIQLVRPTSPVWMLADWNCVGEWATSAPFGHVLVTVTSGRVYVSQEVNAQSQLAIATSSSDHHIYGYVMSGQYEACAQYHGGESHVLETDDVVVVAQGRGLRRCHFLFQEVQVPARLAVGTVLRGCCAFEDLFNEDETRVVGRRVLLWTSVEGEAPVVAKASEQAVLDLGLFMTNRFRFGIEVEGRVLRGKSMKFQYWHFHDDGSVKARSKDHEAIELSSKVLTAETLEAALAELAMYVSDCGFESSPELCAGIHVHVSPEDGGWTEEDLKAFRRLAYVAGPGMLSGATAPSEGRRTYCGTSSAKEARNGQENRYRWLNVDAAFKKFGTVEFRLFDGSHDIAKVREMVHFAKSVATLVQDFGMQAGDELLNILGGAA